MPDSLGVVTPCPKCLAVAWFGGLCWFCQRPAVRVRDEKGERTVRVPPGASRP